MIAPDLAALAVPLGRLDLLPGNPRRGDVDAVARSYEAFGQRKPIVARRVGDRGVVIAGNHQLAAARKLGWSEIAVVWTDDDDETAAAFALADNRTAELGGYDEAALAVMLGSVGDAELLAATGWSEEAIKELLAGLAPETPSALTDPDDVPEVPTDPVSVLGDVWELGPHRLVVADSTSTDAYDELLAGDQVDMIWTDPPYNVAVAGGTHDARDRKNHGKGPKIENDRMSDAGFRDFLRSAFSLMWAAVRPGGVVYVCHSDTEGINFRCAFQEAGFFLHEVVIWVKQEFVFGRSDYHWQHEPILYGWRTGAGHHFYGERNQSTTWQVDRPMRSAMEHPTQKPVALPIKAICNNSQRGAVVLDPFAGSGSTVIAAHTEGRVARLIELDPRYADVICRRFQEHTGVVPIRDGEPHDFTRAAA